MLKKVIIPTFALILIIVGAYLFLKNPAPENGPANVVQTSDNAPVNASVISNTNQSSKVAVSGFVPPLTRPNERVTKKPFGIYITPQNSPVQPERFQGFHTGTDFEVFPDELNAEVPVSAVCSGPLKLKQSASGYGGVAVQACELNNEPLTVIYGHLNLASISFNPGDELTAGEQLGVLGAGGSAQTDGERKHLHLGFHKGADINIRGYVSTEAQLADWIDSCLVVCRI